MGVLERIETAPARRAAPKPKLIVSVPDDLPLNRILHGDCIEAMARCPTSRST